MRSNAVAIMLINNSGLFMIRFDVVEKLVGGCRVGMLRPASQAASGSGVARNFVCVGGVTNSVEDRNNGDLGAVASKVRGSGGSCNLVQEISLQAASVSGVPSNFVLGRLQQIQLRTERTCIWGR